MNSRVLRLLTGVSLSVVLTAAPVASARAAPRTCFRNHLREAIGINKQRAPLYSALTNGRSDEISSELIAGERLAVFGSYLFYNFDQMAETFQKNGIGIVCDEFVSMNLVPGFQGRNFERPHIANFKPFDPLRIQLDLMKALQTDFNEVRDVASHYIEEIDSIEPRFNCMTKHLLASVARIAWLASEHIQAANRLRLDSPESLSRSMISSHFSMIKSAARLDELAAPIQADGVAIICQDVPPITFP